MGSDDFLRSGVNPIPECFVDSLKSLDASNIVDKKSVVKVFEMKDLKKMIEDAVEAAFIKRDIMKQYEALKNRERSE